MTSTTELLKMAGVYLGEWQSIETAPKDDHDRLLWNGWVACVGFWDEDDECWKSTFIRVNATHWMPIPEPPKGDNPS